MIRVPVETTRRRRHGGVLRRRSPGLVVVLALLLTAACAHTGPGPAPSAAPPTSSAPPGPPPAADGTDASACQDGTCEIMVTGPVAIPLDPRYGAANLRVESVTADMVTFTAESTRLNAYRSDCGGRPDCERSRTTSIGRSATSPPMLRVEAVTGYRVEMPALIVEVVDVRGGSAVLRISHPTATDGTDLAACQDGTCSVAVGGPASIPLDPRFGLTGVRVLSVAPDSVTLRVGYSGDLRVECGPGALKTCPTTSVPGGIRSTVLVSGGLDFPGIDIDVLAVDQGAAVLRLTPSS